MKRIVLSGIFGFLIGVAMVGSIATVLQYQRIEPKRLLTKVCTKVIQADKFMDRWFSRKD